MGAPVTADLTHLLALCSSEWCRTELAEWISTAKEPVSIAIFPSGDGYTYTVGQYGSGNADWLRRKVLQYPMATAFKVAGWATESQVPGLREAREGAQMAVRPPGRAVVP